MIDGDLHAIMVPKDHPILGFKDFIQTRGRHCIAYEMFRNALVHYIYANEAIVQELKDSWTVIKLRSVSKVPYDALFH